MRIISQRLDHPKKGGFRYTEVFSTDFLVLFHSSECEQKVFPDQERVLADAFFRLSRIEESLHDDLGGRVFEKLMSIRLAKYSIQQLLG